MEAVGREGRIAIGPLFVSIPAFAIGADRYLHRLGESSAGQIVTPHIGRIADEPTAHIERIAENQKIDPVGIGRVVMDRTLKLDRDRAINRAALPGIFFQSQQGFISIQVQVIGRLHQLDAEGIRRAKEGEVLRHRGWFAQDGQRLRIERRAVEGGQRLGNLRRIRACRSIGGNHPSRGGALMQIRSDGDRLLRGR